MTIAPTRAACVNQDCSKTQRFKHKQPMTSIKNILAMPKDQVVLKDTVIKHSVEHAQYVCRRCMKRLEPTELEKLIAAHGGRE